ncbi:DUF2497 domain-containing protein [Amorphus sp. 3PC139-8]
MDAFSAALASDDEDDAADTGPAVFPTDDWPESVDAPADIDFGWGRQPNDAAEPYDDGPYDDGQDIVEEQAGWQEAAAEERPAQAETPRRRTIWADEAEPEPVYRSFRQRVREEEPAAPEPRSDLRGLKAEGEDIRRLLSSNSSRSVGSAFDSLARSVEQESPAESDPPASGKTTLEDLVADCLRPMLRTWLDENLPSLVERMVREEIERVARKSR